MYKPQIIAGKVKDTGYPIDGHVLYFARWDYDRENWHLYGWEDEDDEAVMLTMHQNEFEMIDLVYDKAESRQLSLEAFTANWKAKQWTPDGPFCLTPDLVEVVEVKQEEEKDDAREKLISAGFDLTPRKSTDEGGILCLPMEKNLKGDIKAKHPDWELIECPHCGRKCWKTPEADKLERTQGVKLLCTECALEAGLLSPYHNKPQPNREQRRNTEKREGSLSIQILKKYRDRLTTQQYKTLRGQILAGDRKGAAAGLQKILERATKGGTQT